MENKCAGAIAHFLVSMLPEIKAKERVIKYGVELIITASVGLLLAAFVSLIAGKPIAWIAFILGFAPLRTTAGGFHASSHLGCYIITTTTFAVSVTFSLIGNVTVWHYIIISTLSSIVMLILSPIAAMNKPLSPTKRLANRYISLLIIGLELVVSLLCVFYDIQHIYIDLFYFGIFAASISLIAAKINNLLRKETKT